MRNLMIGLAAAGCALGSPAALAACHQQPIRYFLQGDTVQVALRVAPGETCTVDWSAGGTAVERATLLSKPRNGQATVSPSALRYAAGAGAMPGDAFGIQLCGTGRSGRGCSTLQVNVSP
jgi:hypothetical protein